MSRGKEMLKLRQAIVAAKHGEKASKAKAELAKQALAEAMMAGKTSPKSLSEWSLLKQAYHREMEGQEKGSKEWHKAREGYNAASRGYYEADKQATGRAGWSNSIDEDGTHWIGF